MKGGVNSKKGRLYFPQIIDNAIYCPKPGCPGVIELPEKKSKNNNNGRKGICNICKTIVHTYRCRRKTKITFTLPKESNKHHL